MKKFTVALTLGAAIGMVSSAGAVVTDGNFNDWFTYGGNLNDNTWNENLVTLNNSAIRFLNDEEGPTPGGGGQRYDNEEIFYFFMDNDVNDPNSGGTLHIGLVTGFPPQGVPADNLYAGDMFIDLGNTGSYTHAIGVSTRAGTDVARFAKVWGNSGAPNWGLEGVVTAFTASNPYRVKGASPGAIALPAGTATVAIGQHGVRYFYEIAMAVDGAGEDALTNPLSGGLGLHWTMQCGNDVIRVRDNTPLVPVPEPSTLALLGMGVVGAALRRKFAA